MKKTTKNEEMTVNARVRTAVENAAPNDAASVINDVKAGQSVMVETQTKKTKRRGAWRAVVAAALALVLMGGAFAGGMYFSDARVASIVALDVNPSIEISVNKKERVLDVRALNDDAAAIIGDMDFKGSTLDVTVNALVGAMVREGYLSDIANSILVSVDGGGDEYASRLREHVSNLIGAMFDGAVMTQTVTPDKELDALADKYGITKGKARLIAEITTQNPRHTFEELVALSINELNLIRTTGAAGAENSGSSRPDDIVSQGTPSAGAYIGADKAYENALAHAASNYGAVTDAAALIKAPLDYEHGVMVYELEFYAYSADGEHFEFEYDVNAKTGEIVGFECELADKGDSGIYQPPVVSGSSVPESEAKATALSHAGVKESDIYAYTCKRDFENGVEVYEIDFKCAGYEYDYEIAVATGAIVKSNKEVDDDYRAPETTKAPETTAAPSTSVTEAEAKATALKHAGVNESDIYTYTCKRDFENGVEVYEIDFKCAGYEYDYEIAVATGKIVKSNKEVDDDYRALETTKAPETTAAPSTAVTEAEAKATALAHAGVKESAIYAYTCKRDFENGVEVYEIDFKCAGYEYDYEIAIATGKIVKSNKEVDDDYRAPETTKAPETTAAPSTSVTEAEAKAAALSHAGVKESDIYAYTCKRDFENGVEVYEIDFKCAGYEYDYEIAIATGKIVKSNKEVDDDYHHDEHDDHNTSGSASVTAEQAKSIALTHANVDAGSIYDYECELDREHGTDVYEISFKSGRYEYEYEINASTGAIIKSDREIDD